MVVLGFTTSFIFLFSRDGIQLLRKWAGLSDSLLTNRIKWKWQSMTSETQSWKAMQLPPCSLSWAIYSGESQMPLCKDIQRICREAHAVRNRGSCQLPRERAIFEVDSPPVKLSDEGSPCWLNYCLTKYPEPKPPSKLLLNSCKLI